MSTLLQYSDECAARSLSRDPEQLEDALRRASQSLRPAFAAWFRGSGVTFDRHARTLTSRCGRYQLEWQLRRYPDRPAGECNPQCREGHVQLVVKDAFVEIG